MPQKREQKGFPQDPVLALRARALLSETRQLVLAEQWREAAPRSAALVQVAPDLAEAHELMGIAAFKTGAMPIAERCFERAIAIGPATAARLFHWGKALSALGEPAAAEKALHRALLVRGNDPEILAALGDAQLSQGRHADALRSFRRLLKLQPGHAYASHMVSALDQAGRPDLAYVTRLFDDYADIFDQHLTGALGYKVPEALAAMLKRHRPLLGTALDIGCGTGLMAQALDGLVERIDGIDLAPRMVEKAKERGLYRHLAIGDANLVLADDPAFSGPYDLVLAADVFIYMGAIEALMERIMAVLAPGGLLAFSVESADGEDIEIRSSGRFAHSAAYIERLAALHGLVPVDEASHDIRLENHQPIKGKLHVLERPK